MTGTSSNQSAYHQAWAEMMVNIWQEKMKTLGVGDTGELLKSFAYHVDIESNGDVSKIVHSYLYYGRMVDMGVGNGVKISDVPSGKREPKDWYGSAYFRSIKILTEKQAELYGEQYQVLIREMLNF
jgi:hypothetical protein